MHPIEQILRLLIAAILGGIIGVERESVHKPAGLRTHVFVSMGSALFTLIALAGIPNMSASYDPYRMIGSILTGVGFIGGGVIIHRSDHQVEGITTAAGLWVAAGIGISVGIGNYVLAIATVLITLITLLGVGRVSKHEE